MTNDERGVLTSRKALSHHGSWRMQDKRTRATSRDVGASERNRLEEFGPNWTDARYVDVVVLADDGGLPSASRVELGVKRCGRARHLA